MKGWQNYLRIAQKVRRNDDYINKIISFENNEYLTTQEINNELIYKFPQMECFSLAQLIESIKFNFIKIYKGQLLTIILEILKHLYQLHQITKMSHGQLTPQNIVIRLKNDSNCKLTMVQTKFSLQNVYFINYKLFEDLNYGIDQSKDISDIIDCSITFIEAIQEQNCQLSQYINNFIKSLRNQQNQDNLNKLIDFFNNLIKDCVDLKEQKVKKTTIYNTSIPNNQLNLQTVVFQELEEYGILSKRNRTKTLIQNFIEAISSQQLTQEVIFDHGNKEQWEDQILIQIYDTSQLNLEEFKIFNIFQQIMLQKMMRTIWIKSGQFLESNKQDFFDEIEYIVKVINQDNKKMLNDCLSLVLQEFKNVNQLNENIKVEIEKSYKFDITYDLQKAKDQFILELQAEAQNFDQMDIQDFIAKIKKNVTQGLQEYYNDLLQIEILKIEDDLF